MQYRVVKFASDLCRDLGWLLWIDQVKETPLEFESEGKKFQQRWTGEEREGDFLDYNFHIEPYSMQYKSPSERINGLTQFVTQIAMPMQQQLQVVPLHPEGQSAEVQCLQGLQTALHAYPFSGVFA